MAKDKTRTVGLQAAALILSATIFLISCGTKSEQEAQSGPCSTWSLLENYEHGGFDSAGFGIGADSAGNVYSVGHGGGVWLIRRSTDHGTTWSVVDEFVYNGDSFETQAHGFGTDSAGNLYAVGHGWAHPDASYYSHWLVRKSATGASGTWATVDDVGGGAGYQGTASAVAADASGVIFVAGYLKPNGFGNRWLVRKSTDNGTTWSESDNYAYPATPGGGVAKSVAKDAAGNVYVAGYVTDSGGKDRWIVRKSTDHGATWSTVDDFVYVSGQKSQALGIGVDAKGTVYAVGAGTAGPTAYHWIVRKSTDGGATWTIADDFVYPTDDPSSPHGQAQAVAVDGAGRIFVTGFGATSVGSQHAIAVVRMSTDQGATWTTVDTYQPSANVDDGYGYAIASDGFGRVFLAGMSYFLSDRWLLRACR